MSKSDYYCESTGVELSNDTYRTVGKAIEDFAIKAGEQIDQCAMCRFRNGLVFMASIGGKQVARVADSIERENYKRLFLETFEHALKETTAAFAREMH